MAGHRDPALLVKRHRTIGRVAAILETVAASEDSIRLSTLTEALDAPKSSIFGLLKGLVSVGYLVEQDGTYTLGPAIRGLLGRIEEPLEDVARGPMRTLWEQFDETVVLGHRVGDSIVFIAAIESHQPIRYSPQLHHRGVVLPTSMGKVYVAELSRADREAYVTSRHGDSDRRKALLADLDEVERTGIGINRNETVQGLCGVAAGIRERGELRACLSVVGPSDRMMGQLDRMADAVRETAAQVTSLLP